MTIPNEDIVAAVELGAVTRYAGRPCIDTRERLHVVAARAIRALADANDPMPCVFRRGGALCRVRRDQDERPIIERLGEDEMRGLLDRVADFEASAKGKNGEGKTVSARPPRDVVRDVLSSGEWDELKVLDAVLGAPALRRDGSVISEPGYDAASRMLLMPDSRYPPPRIPHAPDTAQRRDALARLDDAIGQFPFADAAGRANALALILTPCLRAAIAGGVPLALLDSPRPGTGKGLLVNLTAMIHTGRMASLIAAPTREEEWHKLLLSALMAGRGIIGFDEVSELRSAALASALTQDPFEGRILGQSKLVEVPQRATWAAAGNNVRITGPDMPRRCYWVRMDAERARPWERDGFRHDPLLGWAQAHRWDLLCACLI